MSENEPTYEAVQKPTLGRIVYYCPTEEDLAGYNLHPATTELAAIVVHVKAEYNVNLHVFLNGPGTIYRTDVKYSVKKFDGGTWRWPHMVR